MKIHDLCKIFPLMSPEEFAGFKSDIAANGLREPIWTHDGMIIDGRNRARACDELGITPKTREWNGKGSLVEFVVSLNLHRRHLTSSQRAACGAEVEQRLAVEAKEQQRAGGRSQGGDRRSPLAMANQSGFEQTIKDRLPARLPEADKPKNRENESREKAAKIVGTSPRYVQDAKIVKEKSPDLHEKVKAGKITLPQAKREVARIEKEADLEAKAKIAESEATTDIPPWRIDCGDCINLLDSMEPGCARLIFADPPYNQAVDYGSGKKADRLPKTDYLAWVEQWMRAAARLLADDGSMWVMISDEYAAHFRIILEEKIGLDPRAWIKWYESFGVNCSNNFNRTSRHLFYMVKDAKRFVFNAEAVSRPSDRQSKYGDKRADPGGKIWDDVWGINPPIPRIVGNHAERLPGFPTQLPLDLLRAVVGCASEPGDLIVDPFSGSGTTGVAAVELGRRYLGIESSSEFVRLSRLRLTAAKGVAR